MSRQDEFVDSREYYGSEVGVVRAPREFVFKGVPFPGYCSRDSRGILADPSAFMEYRKDDVFFAAYPKSGQTWTLQMARRILIESGHLAPFKLSKSTITFLEFDFHSASTINVDITRKYLRTYKLPANYQVTPKSSSELLESTASPRLIKTHLPYQFFPPEAFKKGSKVIYNLRNPKDVCVSFYYHYLMDPVLLNSAGSKLTWDHFFNAFIRNQVIYGDWFDHVLNWWRHCKDDHNTLFLRYEDLIKDHSGNVKKIAEFLGCPLTENAIKRVVEATSFATMQNNPSINFMKVKGNEDITFIRKGVIGDWRNIFTTAQSDEFDALFKKRLQGTELFEYFEKFIKNIPVKAKL